MQANHIYKCRAAGGYFFLSFFVSFSPFFSFVSSSHISTESYIVEIYESELFHCFAPAFHGNVSTKLTFCGRSSHCVDVFAFS